MGILLDDAGEFAAAYLDDVVIHSTTGTTMLIMYVRYCSVYSEGGLTIKPKKCQFAMSQCTYLGYVIGNGEVRPEMSKVQAVETFPTPKTKKQAPRSHWLLPAVYCWVCGYRNGVNRFD
jgi:hypothetical protein